MSDFIRYTIGYEYNETLAQIKKDIKRRTIKKGN